MTRTLAGPGFFLPPFTALIAFIALIALITLLDIIACIVLSAHTRQYTVFNT